MITFITGVPGSSKTLNTIAMIDKDWGASGRPIYYRGIKDLSLEWEEITDEQAASWYELPEGSIILIDEAQDIWGRRSPNQPIPEGVQRMAKHRHGGYDLFIITQKHTQVDHDLRNYAGRHLHYERHFGWNSARQWDFNKAVDPDDHFERKEAVSKRINFPKKYFSAYRSAEVHTFKKRVPTKLYILGALFVCIIGLGFAVVEGATNPDSEDISYHEADKEDSFFHLDPPSGIIEPDQEMSFSEQFTPRVPDVPHSAPAYDAVTEVKTFPRPQCMMSVRTTRCRCYTQQATPLNISKATCINIVQNGWFNPYLDETEKEARAEAQPARDLSNIPPPPTHSTVVVLRGKGNVPTPHT